MPIHTPQGVLLLMFMGGWMERDDDDDDDGGAGAAAAANGDDDYDADGGNGDGAEALNILTPRSRHHGPQVRHSCGMLGGGAGFCEAPGITDGILPHPAFKK